MAPDSLHSRSVDLPALRAWRLGRLRDELKARDLAGALLYDPINLRYACDVRNMAVWCLHNAVRYVFVPTEGPVVLFDFHNCCHLSDGNEVIAEVRPAIAWYYFAAAERADEHAARWAAEIADLVAQRGGGNRRLAIDKCDFLGVAALRARGVEVVDGQSVLEHARCMKGPEEIACLRTSVAVCAEAMDAMRSALTPGMRENELWAILNHVNAARGGEWIETRLLAAGGRSNPWFHECGEEVIEAGDLVSFDSDMIGPCGYCADVSRCFLCGEVKPSDEQRRLYRLAAEQVAFNMDLLKPGLGFRELAERAWRLPPGCVANRYSHTVHGVGLCDEYPGVACLQDYEATGYDGVFQAGMTVCVESYIGEEGGHEGVKLEQQVLITETGVEMLSTFPLEDTLLGREI